MKHISRTNHFKKDVKEMKKREKTFDVFKEVIQKLAQGKRLDQRFHDHKLRGNYAGTRECHIEPDWLLIYEANDEELILARTGTHSDLFG
jgi:mRNA interferase YafQ